MPHNTPEEPMVLSESEATELLVYLTVSARIQLDEPCLYASDRLLSAAAKLREAIAGRVSPETRAVFDTSDALSDEAHAALLDTSRYTVAVDALCATMAHHLVERSGIEGDRHE